MICPHCHASLVDAARFCPACGKATAPTATQAEVPPGGAVSPDLVGREIAGRYRILAKLGEGGMGAVYRGEQISLKRAVAVKVLRPELSANPTLLRRFNAEAEAVAKLSHPNTVNIYDFGQDTDGSLFIAMEFIEGRSLRSAIHHEGPLAPARALAIAAQVAASLADAHAHAIVHRDLKPDNVMLQERGKQRDIVRVLDFGIAKLRDDSRATQQAMTQAGDMLGTPQYMAPEQIRGEQIDGRTDIYALGCMIYEMVTGRLPYEAPTIMAMLSKHLLEVPVPPSARRPDLGLPPVIDQLVAAAMAKDPGARPPTMEQFGEQIAAVIATLPADPQRAPSGGRSAVQGVMSAPAITPAAPSAYPGPGAVGPALTPAPPMSTPPGAPSTAPPAGFAPTSPPPGFAPGSPPPGFAPTSPPPGFAPMSPPPAGALLPTGTPAPAGTSAAKAGGRTAIVLVVLVLVLGGGGVGVWLATRGSSSGSGTPAAEHGSEHGSDHGTPPTVPTEPPGPSQPPKSDPWGKPNDPWGPKGAARPGAGAPAGRPGRAPGAGAPADRPGNTIDVGQGVQIWVPPGLSYTMDPILIAKDPRRGLQVAVWPIDSEVTDPHALAREYAHDTGLALDQVQMLPLSGVERPAALLHGTVDGEAIAQLVVAFIGPGYRVAVAIQVPADKQQDDATLAWANEFLTQHVILP